MAKKDNLNSYELANFAIDGATTTDMLQAQHFDQVIPTDEDHPNTMVNQLANITNWSPETVVLSVGGNNYRLTLQGQLLPTLIPSMNVATSITLEFICSIVSILCRFTPQDDLIRHTVLEIFNETHDKLISEYKQIIDRLVEKDTIKRLVISSQYYPALTPASFYFIYTGFSHLAHAKGLGQSPFQVTDEILQDLYRDVLKYAAEKNIEVIFADVTSSMSPLEGNLTAQIEPNRKGSQIIGQLMAEAIDFEIPNEKKQNSIPILRLNKKKELEINYLEKDNVQTLKLKTIEEFIQEDRYTHIKLLFAKDTNIGERFICFYELLAGKQFDNEYQGLFAFGLLDLSLVTIAASYLWRIALNENMNFLIRMTSGLISGPILILKHAIALIILLMTLVTVFLIIQTVKQFMNLGISLKNSINQCFPKISTEESNFAPATTRH